MSKYGVISGPYFPVFNPNAGKYGLETTTYLDTFHAVTAFFFTKAHNVYKSHNIHDITSCPVIKYFLETYEFNKCPIRLKMYQLRIVDFVFYIIPFVLVYLIN